MEKLLKNSKLTPKQIEKLINLFVLEIPASKAASIINIHRHSAERIYHLIRLGIARKSEKDSPSNIRPILKKHPLGLNKKIPVFAILRETGKIHISFIKNVTKDNLTKIVRNGSIPANLVSQKLMFDGIIFGAFKHCYINPDIEGFIGYAKTKLRQYCGVNRNFMEFYLKEIEFRYNHRGQDLNSLIKIVLG